MSSLIRLKNAHYLNFKEKLIWSKNIEFKLTAYLSSRDTMYIVTYYMDPTEMGQAFLDIQYTGQWLKTPYEYIVKIGLGLESSKKKPDLFTRIPKNHRIRILSPGEMSHD